MRPRTRREHGQAILEVALTLPLLLLVCVGIFEFGRAYQTWQVLTNAAREGARMSSMPNSVVGDVQTRVRQYMQDGALPLYGSAGVAVDPAVTLTAGSTTATASVVTVSYPFSFVVLNPIARLIVPTSSLGAAFMMTTTAEMRNESP